MIFDIGIKDADSNEDIKISMSNMFRSITLSYKYNSFPSAKLAFAVTDLNWNERNNLIVNLRFQDYSTKIDLGIDSVSYDGNQIIIEGLMTHRNHSTIRRSRYLGVSAPDVITKELGFTQKLVDVEANKVKYWQFNESDVSTLEKILIGNKPYSIYYITEDKIGIRDLTQSYNSFRKPMTQGEGFKRIVYDSRYKTPDDFKLNSTDLAITSVNTEKLSDDAKFKFGMRSVLGRSMICDKDDNTVGNALTNWITNLDLNMIIETGYSQWLEFDVGDIIEYNFYGLKDKLFIVLEIDKTFIGQDPYTYVRFGALR